MNKHETITFDSLEVEGLDDGTLIITSEAVIDEIAELPYRGPHWEDKQRAYAWLFAAAPRLLDVSIKQRDALNKCIRYFLGTGPQPQPEDFASVIKETDEAIDLATQIP